MIISSLSHAHTLAHPHYLYYVSPHYLYYVSLYCIHAGGVCVEQDFPLGRHQAVHSRLLYLPRMQARFEIEIDYDVDIDMEKVCLNRVA